MSKKIKKVSLSASKLSFEEVNNYYDTSVLALRHFYADLVAGSIPIPSQFVGMSAAEIREDESNTLNELNKSSSMSLLGVLEADFRLDYLKRVRERQRDDLSRSLREVYKEKKARASLKDDILKQWKTYRTQDRQLLSDLIAALNYRDWLAHGRYWTPKLGREYDYTSINTIAQQVYTNLLSVP